MRYAVRDVGAAVRAAAATLLPGAVAVAALALVFDHPVQAGLVAVVLVGAGGVAAYRAGRLLVVDQRGIALAPVQHGRGLPRSRQVPWPHVLRVEVLQQAQPSPGVRVVLLPDAPLPWWVRGRVFDPADPEAGVRVEQAVTGLDAVALQQAVGAQAPRVTVVWR